MVPDQARRLSWLLALLSAGCWLLAPPVHAQATPPVAPVAPAPAHAVPVVPAPAPAHVAAGTLAAPIDRVITLHAGRSQEIRSEWPVKGASLTDPAVADVQVLNPTLLVVSGTHPGVTDLLLWGEAGQTLGMRVEVSTDLDRLQAAIVDMFPGSDLRVSESGGVIVVSGTLQHTEQVQQLHDLLVAQKVPSVDLTHVTGVQQVQVQVRLAEVSRTGLRELGVNLLKTGGGYFGGSVIGPASGGPINPISIGPTVGSTAAGDANFAFNQAVNVSPAVTLFAGFPGSNLQAFVQALAENQYLRILAEPNLVALSGEEARFLAGGEFPIPVVQGGGTSGSTSVTIEYKKFGVLLAFRPVVEGDGNIRIKVFSEVSELSDVGAVVLQGFQVPSIATRNAETTVEMKSGQTFAMAGLLSQTSNATSSRVPGLGDLPVLGALFRSTRYKSGETELVLLVTASLVEPLSNTQFPTMPGADHVVPSDWEVYAEGRIEGDGGAVLSSTDAEWLKVLGLDTLSGPGGWSSHGQAPAASRTHSNSTSAPTAASPATAPIVTTAEPIAAATDSVPAGGTK